MKKEKQNKWGLYIFFIGLIAINILNLIFDKVVEINQGVFNITPRFYCTNFKQYVYISII